MRASLTLSIRRRSAGENGIPEIAPDEEGKSVVLRDEGCISGRTAESGLTHSLATKSAIASDVTQACVLLHG